MCIKQAGDSGKKSEVVEAGECYVLVGFYPERANNFPSIFAAAAAAALVTWCVQYSMCIVSTT